MALASRGIPSHHPLPPSSFKLYVLQMFSPDCVVKIRKQPFRGLTQRETEEGGRGGSEFGCVCDRGRGEPSGVRLSSGSSEPRDTLLGPKRTGVITGGRSRASPAWLEALRLVLEGPPISTRSLALSPLFAFRSISVPLTQSSQGRGMRR